jgi:hypothetical protein
MKKAFFYQAMACMVLELSYINTKSLFYLVEDFDLVGRTFAVIGAVAFSMVTILVMRTSHQKWVKYVFPVFDIMLVFCGLNLRFANNLLANPVAFALTILIALFVGLITYSLGIIDINKVESDKDAAMNLLKDSLASRANEIERLQSELEVKRSEVSSLKSYNNNQETVLKDYKTEVGRLKSQLKQLESVLEIYRKSHLLFERSRILKKKESNRTAEELKILEEAINI